MDHLDLGWAQNYIALYYHLEEAYLEQNGIHPYPYLTDRPPIALFSKKYCKEIDQLDHTKYFDFCFIGSIQSNRKNRQWVIDFALKYFTSRSIFINTDHDPNWKLLGSFDYSNRGIGFCPKNVDNNQTKQVQYRTVSDNLFYFQTMCQSQFILCPAGDSSWSFRFYETLMCKAIPIVESWHHTYRTKEESIFNYQYILKDHIHLLSSLPYQFLVQYNTELFHTVHLLPSI